MLKINQMKPKEFISFVNSLRKSVKGNKLNLSDLEITEKIDGTSLRFAMLEGALNLESSYSGLQAKPSDFKGPFAAQFSETFKFLKAKGYEKKLKKISDKYGDFKVVGEYLYTDGAPIDKDGTITFVATKYNPDKLGKFGTFVVFDVQQLTDNKESFIAADSNVKSKIVSELTKINDSNWKFLTKKDIKWSGELELTYEIAEDKLSEILSSAEFLSDKANKETFTQIKMQVADAFTQAMVSKGSVLGIPSSTVEGVVLKFGDGMVVGAQNPGWKVLKNKIFEIPDRISKALATFTKGTMGYVAMKKVRQILDDPEKRAELQDKYQQNLGSFKKDIDSIDADWRDLRDQMPKNIERLQGKFIDEQIMKFRNLGDDIESLQTALKRK
jgi:hypothetical protein